jgi:thiol-disulfide isomerase/thioredoxin
MRWLARRERVWLLRAGIVACGLVALVWLLVARISAPAPSAPTSLSGHPAPAFTLSAAQDGAMLPAPVRFPAASGRPTLLVFFNTLCVHCLSEIGVAREVATHAPGGPLDVIFVDTPGENAQITGAYMARIQLDPPVLLDSGVAVAGAYRVGYGPTIILVDERGTVRGAWVGETSATALASGIVRALNPYRARQQEQSIGAAL